jgi:hypothetical protein
MNKRKILDVIVRDYIQIDNIFDGHTPHDIIDHMEDIKQQFKDRYVYFNVEYDPYEGTMYLELRESREENDQEYEQRLATEQKIKEKEKKKKIDDDARELAEYERLKKKFEDQSGVEK